MKDPVLKFERKIGDIKSLFLNLARFYFICWVMIACAVLFGSSYLIDRVLILGNGYRVVMFIILLAAFAFIVYRLAKRSLFIRLTDSEIALLLEQKFPAFNDTLITSVELKDTNANQSLYNNVIRIADAEISNLSTGRIFDYQSLIKGGIAAFIILGAFFYSMYSFSDEVKTWYERCLQLKDVTWSTETTFNVAGIERGITVGRGQDYNLEVQAEGKVPDSAVIHYKVKGGRWFSGELRKGNDGMFFYKLSHMTDHTLFYITGGDYLYDFPVYELDVKEPPYLVQKTVLYNYPGYTGLDPMEVTDFMEIRALRGSEARCAFRSDRELESFQALFNEKQLDVTKEGKDQFIIFMLLDKEGELELKLRDTKGIESTLPVGFPVRLIEDRKPSVRWRYLPLKEAPAFTKRAVINLEIETSDDYGISESNLVVRYSDKEMMYDFSGGKVSLDLGSVGINEEQYLTLTARVKDNRNPPPLGNKSNSSQSAGQVPPFVGIPNPQQRAGQVSETAPFGFYIISDQELDNLILNQVAFFKRIISDLLAISEKLLGQWAFVGPESDTVSLRVQDEAHSILVNTLKEDLGKAVFPIDYLLEVIRINKKQYDHTLVLKAVRADLDKIVKLVAEASDVSMPYNFDVYNKEARIHTLLAAIIKALSFWKDYQEIIMEFTYALENEESIINVLSGTDGLDSNQISDSLSESIRLQDIVYERLARVHPSLINIGMVLAKNNETVRSNAVRMVFETLSLTLDKIEKIHIHFLNRALYASLNSAKIIRDDIKMMLGWLQDPESISKYMQDKVEAKAADDVDIKGDPVKGIIDRAEKDLEDIKEEFKARSEKLSSIMPSVSEEEKKAQVKESIEKFEKGQKLVDEVKKKMDEIKEQMDIAQTGKDKKKPKLDIKDLAKALKQIDADVKEAKKSVDRDLFDKSIQDLAALKDKLKRSMKETSEMAKKKEKLDEIIEKEAKGQARSGMNEENVRTVDSGDLTDKNSLSSDFERVVTKLKRHLVRFSSISSYPYPFEDAIGEFYKDLAEIK